MKPEDIELLKKHFDAFEPIVPATGGDIEIVRGPNKGFVAIVGDRTALIRLATAMLKYSIHGNERALVLNNFFPNASQERDFMIQIEDPLSKNSRPNKSHSTIKMVTSLLFKSKRDESADE